MGVYAHVRQCCHLEKRYKVDTFPTSKNFLNPAILGQYFSELVFRMKPLLATGFTPDRAICAVVFLKSPTMYSEFSIKARQTTS